MLQKEIYNNIYNKAKLIREEKKNIPELIRKANDIAYKYGKKPISPSELRMMYDELEKIGIYIGAYYGNGKRNRDNDPDSHIWDNVSVYDNDTDEELFKCRISRYDGYKYGKEYIITFFKGE